MRGNRFVVLLAVIAVGVVVGGLGLGSAYGDDGGLQSDHALFGGGDDALHCGVELKKAEPYTLDVSGTATGSDGTVTLAFRDGDAFTLKVPADTTASASYTFGGVPEVDDRIKITAGGGVGSMIASVLVPRGGAKDPWATDGEKDNFCLTSPDDPGSAEANATHIA